MVYVVLLALVILLSVCLYLYNKLEALRNSSLIKQDALYHEINVHIHEKQNAYNQLEKVLSEEAKRTQVAIQTYEDKLRAEFALEQKSIRQDAIARSKIVNKGFDAETFSPFIQTQWQPTDFRHIGNPIDYLICDGAEAVRSDLQDELKSITLLDIKTGGADLNKVQRRIRDAIVASKVQFAIYNPDDNSLRIYSPTNPKGKICPKS